MGRMGVKFDDSHLHCSVKIEARILLAIEELVSSPFAGTKLRGELDGLLRWRTGGYRIVYKIDEEKRLVVLLDVGPRKAI